jgi:tetratricopeptide (TPR) repeat protein
MSTPFIRAQQLRNHRRHEEAVALLHSHLAQSPEDPAASLALEDARKAGGLEPDEAFPLALQSRILSSLDREKEALPLAESAISLDSDDVFSWNSKTLALCGLQRWKEAEEAARHTLSLDPDDETASNLLAHSLRLQQKLDECENESRRRLARDPENAFSFANAGWAALQRHQVKDAENHFREALRLNPEMEYAKQGLKESFRARSAFYRLFLRWAFFLQRFNEKHRTLIIIGLIFGFRIVRNIAAAIHPLLVIPVVLIYYLFLFGTWLAGGLANFLILRDPIARMSLDRGEKVEGLAVGTLFLGGLLLMIGGVASGFMPLAIAGVTMMVAAIPATLVFTNPSILGRAIFGCAMVAILGLGTMVVLDQAAHPTQKVGSGESGAMMGAAIMIALATTWVSMVPALRKGKAS